MRRPEEPRIRRIVCHDLGSERQHCPLCTSGGSNPEDPGIVVTGVMKFYASKFIVIPGAFGATVGLILPQPASPASSPRVNEKTMEFLLWVLYVIYSPSGLRLKQK